ncbi:MULTISPECIES: hypothetical protein [Stenotrophomonas]|jgi:hypothetical protein|uniref:Lectin n=1 Tax=Stenotrophomonas maltophilia TaxID=40324 RepID=A0A4S2D303_STEMA|nr:MULTISPECIES: hypothetical protein [Stenotrophomonas]MBD3828156.1 hypothetical protein [Stenotrophomonas sp.]QIO89832.1 hypothetical protein G9274_003517 [Stenotrophomonas rhizophila]TGY34584.1 hypothetical protein E5352_09070 [Stenotrophomonas maltophilia]
MKQLGSVLALGLVLAVGACGRTADSTPTSPIAAPAAVPAPAAGPARLDGYGPVSLDSTLDQVRTAWKEPLDGAVPDDYCHSLRPQGAQADDVVFMIEGRRLVRYDVHNDRIVAPGGGKVGMSLGELQTLYPDRGDVTPHKYDEQGHNLRVRPATEGGALINFEIDRNGTVTDWRVGLPPQVDYVEGCL